MKYSIIVPLYNRCKIITTCIEGLMDTLYKDFEVIIVDDGSTDVSYEVSKQLSRKYPNVRVFRQENKGVSAARNLGIEKAQGEYIMFVDSDDTYVPNALCDIDKLLADDQDLLMFRYKGGSYESRSWKRRILPKTKTDVIIQGNKDAVNWIFTTLNPYEIPFYTVWGKVFKKSIIDGNSIRFVEGLSLGEDQIFTCEYLQYVNVLRYVNIPYYNIIFWPKSKRSFGLGSCHRTPDNFLRNQRANYDALIKLANATKLDSVHEYAVNYILDRPITRVLLRNADFRNKNRIGYSELKSVTKSKIVPLLRLEEDNISRLKAKDISFYCTMILTEKPFWVVYCLMCLQQNTINVISPYWAAICRRLKRK